MGDDQRGIAKTGGLSLGRRRPAGGVLAHPQIHGGLRDYGSKQIIHRMPPRVGMAHFGFQQRRGQIGDGKIFAAGFGRQPGDAEARQKRDRQQGDEHQERGHQTRSFGTHVRGTSVLSRELLIWETAHSRFAGMGNPSEPNGAFQDMHFACQGKLFAIPETKLALNMLIQPAFRDFAAQNSAKQRVFVAASGIAPEKL